MRAGLDGSWLRVRRHRLVSASVAAGIIFVMFVALLWRGAGWLYGPGFRTLTPSQQVTALDDVRSKLLQLGGGLIATVALLYTALTFRLSREGHVTDRFAKAIELLGSERIEVRLGAIYALERIMVDSSRDHPAIVELLATFVRERAPAVDEPEFQRPPIRGSNRAAADSDSLADGLAADVQAALTVIGRRPPGREERGRLNLSGANLSNADLSDANLARAALEGTRLCGAKLTGSDLTGVSARNTNFTGAKLTSANLSDSNINEASLTRAILNRAILVNANLRNADLSRAILKEANLTKTIMNHVQANGVNMTKANLTGARLGGAKLTRAVLRGANLSDASFRGAVLDGADLRDIIKSNSTDFEWADLTNVSQ